MATRRQFPGVAGGDAPEPVLRRTAAVLAEPAAPRASAEPPEPPGAPEPSASAGSSAAAPAAGGGGIRERVELLVSVPEAVPAARRRITELLRDWGLRELGDTAALLACELVSNAVKHGSRTGGSPRGADEQRIELTVRHHDALFIEVWDPASKNLHPHVRIAAPHDEVGRGLRLVESLSRAWGHHTPPYGGRTVWCEVAPPGPGARGGRRG